MRNICRVIIISSYQPYTLKMSTSTKGKRTSETSIPMPITFRGGAKKTKKNKKRPRSVTIEIKILHLTRRGGVIIEDSVTMTRVNKQKCIEDGHRALWKRRHNDIKMCIGKAAYDITPKGCRKHYFAVEPCGSYLHDDVKMGEMINTTGSFIIKQMCFGDIMFFSSTGEYTEKDLDKFCGGD